MLKIKGFNKTNNLFLTKLKILKVFKQFQLHELFFMYLRKKHVIFCLINTFF